MKQIGFYAVAVIADVHAEVEYDRSTLTLRGFSQEEAVRLVEFLESPATGYELTRLASLANQQKLAPANFAVTGRSSSSAPNPSNVSHAVHTPAAAPSDPDRVTLPRASVAAASAAPIELSASEIDAALDRGAASAAAPAAVAAPPTRRRGRGAVSAATEAPAAEPPPEPAPHTNGVHTTNGTNGTHAAASYAPVVPAAAPPVDPPQVTHSLEATLARVRQQLGGGDITNAQKQELIARAGKELKFKAPAVLDDAWEALVLTAPEAFFNPPKPKATPAAEKKDADKRAAVAKEAAAHRATLPAAVTAPVLHPDVVAEIRAAFGANPALLADVFKQEMVDRAVEEGLIAPALGADLASGWPAVCENAPVGWFKAFAAKSTAPKSASTPAPAAAAAATDPAGLAPPGVDPDEDPITQGTAWGTDDFDMERLKSAKSLRDVLAELIDKGVRTQNDLIATCVSLKDEVPVLARVNGLDTRIPRALVTIGQELPVS